MKKKKKEKKNVDKEDWFSFRFSCLKNALVFEIFLYVDV